MAAEQVFIGLVTSGLCAVGMAQQAWFLRETRKGRRLVQLCGTRNAAWVFRGLLALGVLFGLALASGFVNPIRWTSTGTPPLRIADSRRPLLPALQESLGRRCEVCG